MNVVKLAHEVIHMQRRIDYLEGEVERLREYEQKYHDELDASIRHGEQVMVGWLDLLLSDRVTVK